MFNFYQPKPKPTKCFCESLIEYFETLGYYDFFLVGFCILILSAFLLYLLRETPLMDWIEQAGRVVNINDGRRTVAVQTAVTINTGEIENTQQANIRGIHCRDNGNNIQDFPNAENDTNIKNTKCEGTINVSTSDKNNSFNMNIQKDQPIVKRDNTGASLSRIPIPKHAQQATVNNANMWNTNSENEDPLTQTNKPEVSQIPTLTKRSR
ncbi:uncharacterized protein LOC111518563 [Drosophila willistoni]|uniref:uncharacterized protein LOC111518563 n=1 Tax=Drosophila willistoni TaxID=7260 RepID=UPI001F0803DC|nr:uncharacterized protein LOC111518563 [Drosophila willistoni]